MALAPLAGVAGCSGFVQTGTVIAWQCKRFRDHWAKLSKHGRPGRPQVPKEIRALIRKMSEANISCGSPRIVGELRKLGIDVAKSTVEKYRVRSRKPPSPTWKAFLNNHVRDLVSIDFFVVPTVRNKVLFVLVVLAHHRRRVVHFNVTEHPISQWTAQQIIEAFPWDTAPKYLLRDRDAIYESRFQMRVQSLGIDEVLTAPQSPWQNAFVERVIGSIRRDFNGAGLLRTMEIRKLPDYGMLKVTALVSALVIFIKQFMSLQNITACPD
ncbi:MAG: hypothetical protein ABFS22_05070 [Pseudomonadota bacterium]